ncbi:Mitochondrial distribution and morphology protein 10, variant 2 [Balamuthia mandrillaris]
MQLNAGSASAPFAPSLRVCYHSPLTSPAFEEVHFHPSSSSPSSSPSSDSSSSSSASLSFLPDKETLSSFHQRLKEKRQQQQQQAQKEERDQSEEEEEEEERPHIIELSAERGGEGEANRSRGLNASQQHQQRLFSVSGEIEWDGTQQAEIVQQLSRRLSCKVWLAAAGGPFQKGQPPRTVMVSSLRYNGPTYTTRLSYTTEKEIFLVNLLKSVTPSVALGCELLYSNTEKKPGCSIGLRYATKEAGKPAIAATQFASSLSFLGHLDTSFTRLVLPNLFIAARHTLNLNSFESNLCIGFELWPASPSSNNNQEEEQSLLSSSLLQHLPKIRGRLEVLPNSAKIADVRVESIRVGGAEFGIGCSYRFASSALPSFGLSVVL